MTSRSVAPRAASSARTASEKRSKRSDEVMVRSRLGERRAGFQKQKGEARGPRWGPWLESVNAKHKASEGWRRSEGSLAVVLVRVAQHVVAEGARSKNTPHLSAVS